MRYPPRSVRGVPSAFVVGAVQLRVREAASTPIADPTMPASMSITIKDHGLAIDAIRARVPDLVPLVMGCRLLVMQTLLGFTSEGRSGKEGARTNILESSVKSRRARDGLERATSKR
jgi:hypothetical protein